MKQVLWDNFFMASEVKSTLAFLKNIPLFDALKTSELVRLERNLHLRRFKKGEIVFSEGDPGAALYIIQEGEIGIYKNYNTNHQLQLTALETQTFFGELALFDESPRSATTVALKETRLLALSKEDLSQFSQKNPLSGFKISMRLGEILSQRLRVANAQIEELQHYEH